MTDILIRLDNPEDVYPEDEKDEFALHAAAAAEIRNLQFEIRKLRDERKMLGDRLKKMTAESHGG